jgi:outer membrane protein assembly factor BamA
MKDKQLCRVSSIDSGGDAVPQRRFRRSAVRKTLAALALGLAALGRADAQAGEAALVIRDLNFRGNDSYSDELPTTAIATTNSSIFATYRLLSWMGLGEKRRLNELELRRDVERLRLFYQVRGSLDVRVDTAVVRTDQDAYITFAIQEGQPVIVRDFQIKSLDSVPWREELLKDLPLREGRPLGPDARLRRGAHKPRRSTGYWPITSRR